MAASGARRTLGSQGLRVAPIGFGCMSIANTYGPSDENESIDLLRHAFDAGVDFFDTADVYGRGLGEQLVGRALKTKRDQVTIATKGGITFREQTTRGVNGDPAYLRWCCHESLRNLGIDVIDLYYLHRVDPQVPIEESIGALSDLVAAGKVRYLGVCEASASTLRRAVAVHPLTALQSEWSLWTRDIEDDILPTARELGIGVVPFCPLGRGLMTASVATVDELPDGDPRRRDPRFVGENFDHHREVASRLEDMAAAKRVSPAQLAIAWLLAQGPDIVPIPGTKRRAYLDENVGAASIALSDDERDALAALVPPELARVLPFQVPGAPARGLDPSVTWA
jgi:aryl-alcohol dehydrogenase-like predicted oxidoreductase